MQPGLHRLIPHPDTPPRSPLDVMVTLTTHAGRIALDYRVANTVALHLPPLAVPERTDGLWKTTCFELFFRPEGGEGYIEFNLSPSRQWAAYAFEGYRSGMRDLPAVDPGIAVDVSDDVTLHARLAGIIGPGRIALSAVIEETDGTKSYWALNHPSGAPDFHHRDCFALELPAPERP